MGFNQSLTKRKFIYFTQACFTYLPYGLFFSADQNVRLDQRKTQVWKIIQFKNIQKRCYIVCPDDNLQIQNKLYVLQIVWFMSTSSTKTCKPLKTGSVQCEI